MTKHKQALAAKIVALFATIACILICGSPQTPVVYDENAGSVAETPEAIGAVDDVPLQSMPEPETTAESFEKSEQKEKEEDEYITLIEPEPEPEPKPELFSIAMMGDCAIASEHSSKAKSNSYESTIGEDYAYPFSNVKHIYSEDDFVIVNLECAISEYNVPREKTYRLRAKPEYVNILIEGGIDFAATGNNHTFDYGTKGYEETLQILEANGVGFAPNGGWNLHTTDSGLVIGVYSKNFPSMADVIKGVRELRDAGAELIITALHWGDEGSYRANSDQKLVAHSAVDAGAHIVMGTHPHVLQEMEVYKEGYIWYSLANWTFGANVNPADKDTVIARVNVMRDIDGSITLIGADNVPCSISSVKTHNDYRPTPYEPGSLEYERVLSKLEGTFTRISSTQTSANEENQSSLQIATDSSLAAD